MAELAPVAQGTIERGYAHAALYYNGYFYVGLRNATYPRLYKVDATNYANQSYITLGGQISDLIRVGDYLWATCYNGRVYKIAISTFTETANYLIVSGNELQSLCSDGTYIYVGATDYLAKILISTGDVTVSGYLGYTYHSICEDGDYLYVITISPGTFFTKRLKTTFANVDSVAIGLCTDDMAQDATYVYLGRETTGEVVRVTKSNLAVYTQSPVGMGYSYGVYLIDTQLLYLDFTNNDIWVFSTPDLGVNRQIELIDLDYSDPINELADDGSSYLHLSQYRADSTPIIKLSRATVLGIIGWTGKISGVTNPAKIMGVDATNIAKVKGVA